MSSNPDAHQVDIFANDQQQLQFAELCNALYERELQSLAHQKANNVGLLQRRLSGLTHHIRRAAEHLLNHQAPIEVDVHNGSWQAKQAAKCVAIKHDTEKTQDWYERYAKMGLVVPVYVMEMGVEHLELDSIDRIDSESSRVHTNKHGWFTVEGSPEKAEQSSMHRKLLLLPNKASMSAACCGHSWNHRGRTQPRALSLRELLLSTTINWKTFR